MAATAYALPNYGVWHPSRSPCVPDNPDANEDMGKNSAEGCHHASSSDCYEKARVLNVVTVLCDTYVTYRARSKPVTAYDSGDASADDEDSPADDPPRGAGLSHYARALHDQFASEFASGLRARQRLEDDNATIHIQL